MKKLIAILAAAALLLTFAACSAKPVDPAPADPTPADPAPTADTTPPIGLPNPVTVYGSLAEINEIVGMKLTHPPVMGVTDEGFKTIDNGEWKIAEYDYKVAGVEYHLRGCPSFDGDISGYYINGEPAFSGMPTDEIEFAEDGDVKLARWATMDGQYVLTAVGATDAFADIAKELKGLTMPGMSENELAAFYEELAGQYYDEFSQRAHMKAEALGADGVRLTVHWSGSAFEYYEWVMTGRLYEDGLLSYSDCVKTLYKTDENGNTSSEVESEGGEGFFTPTEDGKLLWNGAEDDDCRECVFFKPDEDLAAYYAALEGEYYDEYSQRAHMKAEALGADGVRLTVNWAGSVSEDYEWVMTCRLGDDGLLSYDDCVKTLYKTDQSGNTTSEVESEGGKGFFTPTEDGKLLWDGAEEEHCRECIFFIPPEA